MPRRLVFIRVIGFCTVLSTLILGLVILASLQADAAIINEYAIPTIGASPYGITAGPDGNLWFTEISGNAIGRITRAGIVTEYTVPTSAHGIGDATDSSYPYGIAAGPDGNLWFTEQYGNKIGRITTAGVITEFTVPTANSWPSEIAAGPDGNLWFTEPNSNKVGRITTAGVITEYTVPTAYSWPYSITAGFDGNLWFTEPDSNKIGRVTTSGIITEFTVMAPTVEGGGPTGITAGPDGNLWFTKEGSNKIGRITTAGDITEYTVPTANSAPLGIAAGPDGNPWFTEQWGSKIGQITTSGIITEFTVMAPAVESGPTGITAGPDGNLWFTEGVDNQIGRILLTFDDVPSDYWAFSYIEAIYNAGIALGCDNAGDYCPSADVTREQMAAFIIRTLYGENFSYTATPYFSDVSSTDTFFKYVQKLKDMNITTVTGAYNPDEGVTRDQMAAFLVRARQVKACQDTETFSYTTAPHFSDVPSTDTFFKYVQKLKDDGITTMTGTYSAGSNVTRDQMAAFIARSFLGGEGSNCSNSGQTLAQSSLARDTSPQVSDAELAAVVSGNTEFALNVFPLLDTTPGNNTFFSPYSITQAFALLAPGARGTTLSGIEQALSFPLQLDLDRRNAAFNKLDLLLSGETTGAVLEGGIQTPKLNNANAIWGQQGFSFLPAYLDTLAVNYGVGLHLVDFMHATEDSRQTINTWVAGQTNNRIQDLIPPGGVSVDTRLVLTNALWFKANWASPFPQFGTANWSFMNRDGSSSDVPFMGKIFRVPYARIGKCQAVDIPYAGDNMAMLVIMPDAGTFDEFLSALTPAVVGDIPNQLAPKMMAFSMPKFSYTRASSMRSILGNLGMTEVFDPSRADFSGIDGRLDLSVGDIFHQAFISVDESGTEAAAATAVVATTTSLPPSPDLRFTVDHPFIFLIRDRQTGLILFMGKVVSL